MAILFGKLTNMKAIDMWLGHLPIKLQLFLTNLCQLMINIQVGAQQLQIQENRIGSYNKFELMASFDYLPFWIFQFCKLRSCTSFLYFDVRIKNYLISNNTTLVMTNYNIVFKRSTMIANFQKIYKDGYFQ